MRSCGWSRLLHISPFRPRVGERVKKAFHPISVYCGTTATFVSCSRHCNTRIGPVPFQQHDESDFVDLRWTKQVLLAAKMLWSSIKTRFASLEVQNYTTVLIVVASVKTTYWCSPSSMVALSVSWNVGAAFLSLLRRRPINCCATLTFERTTAPLGA